MSDFGIELLTDSYKFTHWKQTPPGTTHVYSYMESRGGMFDNTVFSGLQATLKKYLTGKVVTKEGIKFAKYFVDSHMGPNLFNEIGWRYILDKYDGHLPLRIKAIPEGTSVPVGNVLMSVKNTDPFVPWLTNHVETVLLQTWYPTTVATLSREVKKILIQYLKRTTNYDDVKISEICSFMLHDFGFRGVGSVESASFGGLGHIINFFGTDNIPAILLAQNYYNTTNPLAFSIPASEHSTITSWTEEGEIKAFENMLIQYPTGTIACVSDSYDIVRACRDYWGTTLRDKVLSRDGRLVIRPDSGDPVMTLKTILPILWERFGGEVNSKGFRVLDPHVRVIQGDGVNFKSICDILEMMVLTGFSAENIVFGMGGALLQKIDRDTQKFAFKCSSITIDGIQRDVKKNPLEIDENGETHPSFKASKMGELKLVDFHTIERAQDEEGDQLIEVFKDGYMTKEYTFEEVRKNAEIL